jgi:hypothetical protein
VLISSSRARGRGGRGGQRRERQPAGKTERNCRDGCGSPPRTRWRAKRRKHVTSASSRSRTGPPAWRRRCTCLSQFLHPQVLLTGNHARAVHRDRDQVAHPLAGPSLWPGPQSATGKAPRSCRSPVTLGSRDPQLGAYLSGQELCRRHPRKPATGVGNTWCGWPDTWCGWPGT